MDTPFYNIFRNTHFETPHFDFHCVFDSQNFSFSEKKDSDILTHLAKSKGNASYIRGLLSENMFGDYSLLLSLIEGTQVYCSEYNWGRRGDSKKLDEWLFMSDEIGDFFQVAFEHMEAMNEQEKLIIRRAILLFYEAKHQMFYDDLGGILMMHCFEFLLTAIFRLDKNVNDSEEIDFAPAYKYVVNKYRYDEYIKDWILKEIKPEDYVEFKKKRGVKNIKFYGEDFRKMRNWMAHGQQREKPNLGDSPSDNLWTCLRRVETFIRLILIDMLYGKPYQRKFDALFQLILEQNVRTTYTPEFPQLRFRPSAK